MDVRRVFWSLFAGIGLLFWVQLLAGAAAGTTAVQVALAALRGFVFVALGGYALVEPDRLGGPDRPTLPFVVIVVVFVVTAAATVTALLPP